MLKKPRRTRAEEVVRSRKRQRAIRLEALRVYGGDPPRCMCECGCKEDCWVMLDLEHPNNDGAEHKRMLAAKYSKRRKYRTAKRPYLSQMGTCCLYRTLKKLGWPKDTPLRVMCVYCNVGRARNGRQCPRLGIVPDYVRRLPRPVKTDEMIDVQPMPEPTPLGDAMETPRENHEI